MMEAGEGGSPGTAWDSQPIARGQFKSLRGVAYGWARVAPPQCVSACSPIDIIVRAAIPEHVPSTCRLVDCHRRPAPNHDADRPAPPGRCIRTSSTGYAIWNENVLPFRPRFNWTGRPIRLRGAGIDRPSRCAVLLVVDASLGEGGKVRSRCSPAIPIPEYRTSDSIPLPGSCAPQTSSTPRPDVELTALPAGGSAPAKSRITPHALWHALSQSHTAPAACECTTPRSARWCDEQGD